MNHIEGLRVTAPGAEPFPKVWVDWRGDIPIIKCNIASFVYVSKKFVETNGKPEPGQNTTLIFE